MQKGLYYHPSIFEYLHVPIIPGQSHRPALNQFLECIEAIEPCVTADLYPISKFFTEKVNDELKEFEYRFINDAWSFLRSLIFNLDASEGTLWTILQHSEVEECMLIKEAIYDWAKKWNLTNDSEKPNALYIEIALRAIRRSILNSDGVISLKNGLQDDELPENLRLDLDDFDRNLPFVFAPSSKQKPGFSQYEELWYREEPRARQKLWFSKDLRAIAQKAQNKYVREYHDEWIGVGWDPTQTEWEDFEDEMDRQYAAYKNAYKQRTLKGVDRFSEVGEKRNPEHFEWLVRFQIQGWSMGEISKQYNDGTEIDSRQRTISNGIKDAAELALLKLRPTAKGGRPPGSKTKPRK